MKLYRIAMLVIICTIMAFGSVCMAAMGPRVAVLPTLNKNPIKSSMDSQFDESIATGYVTDAFGNPKLGYELVERAELMAALEEQNLSNSALFDPSTAAQFGRLLGAQYVVINNITSISRMGGKIVVRMMARAINSETGQVYISGTGMGQGADLIGAIEAAADDVVGGKKGIIARKEGRR